MVLYLLFLFTTLFYIFGHLTRPTLGKCGLFWVPANIIFHLLSSSGRRCGQQLVSTLLRRYPKCIIRQLYDHSFRPVWIHFEFFDTRNDLRVDFNHDELFC